MNLLGLKTMRHSQTKSRFCCCCDAETQSIWIYTDIETHVWKTQSFCQSVIHELSWHFTLTTSTFEKWQGSSNQKSLLNYSLYRWGELVLRHCCVMQGGYVVPHYPVVSHRVVAQRGVVGGRGCRHTRCALAHVPLAEVRRVRRQAVVADRVRRGRVVGAQVRAHGALRVQGVAGGVSPCRRWRVGVAGRGRRRGYRSGGGRGGRGRGLLSRRGLGRVRLLNLLLVRVAVVVVVKAAVRATLFSWKFVLNISDECKQQTGQVPELSWFSKFRKNSLCNATKADSVSCIFSLAMSSTIF